MSGPYPRRDWTDRPTEPGRPDGIDARLAVMQGRLLDEENVPLAVPDRPEVQLRRDALDTSARAAQLVAPKSGTQRMRVLTQIAASGSYGATDAELERQLRMSGNSVRPRRGELVEQGWVQDSHRRRTHPDHDGEYAVWELTAAGRKAYDRIVAEEPL